MDSFDLLVIGGGINGAAIARDAAGRGLKVLLVERDDLASHTSSASSKLVHGGLRYLEQRQFRLVRESLRERELLLTNAPHIVRPLPFVLPDPPGGRPFWLLRAGLVAYDLLAGRGSSLPRSRKADKGAAFLAAPLKPGFTLATYWDAQVDDARLVVLNALDAAERGAEIATRTELVSARRDGGGWTATLSGGRTVLVKTIVNAAGAWAAEVLRQRLGVERHVNVRLVKGSHILVPRLWEGPQAYILQQPDRRMVFALPFGERSLIGTTDIAVASPDEASVSDEEVDYLCSAANLYFTRAIGPKDVAWSYSGVRTLYDDGAASAQNLSREYRLDLDPGSGSGAGPGAGGKLLSVFGGKLTNARGLAAEALEKLKVGGFKFTATTPLPGGDIDARFNAWLAEVGRWMPPPMLARVSRAYGTRLKSWLGEANSVNRLGRHFGADLYQAEVDYLVATEFAQTADDILWRRSKLGLETSPAEQDSLRHYLGG
ncbi:MAG: glycerol-3-phosphate dehydrogenase [Sphingosinicella sp.]